MKLLTIARDLKRRKARERTSLFVAEGVRTVEELLRSDLTLTGAVVSSQLADRARERAILEALTSRGVVIQTVSEADFASAAHTESPQGVLVMAEVPARSLHMPLDPRSSRMLLLDGIQDPGNVGTLLRTAAAFSVDATIALPGTVDLWNAKVVRSAVGAQFHHHAVASTWDQLSPFIRGNAIEVWGGEAGAAPVPPRNQLPKHLALIVGNEGSGLSEQGRSMVNRAVGIPINAQVESLNVAVATGILLYEIRN